jgi:hypothetical protein
LEIAWFAEDDFVDREEFVESNDRKTDAAGDLLPVCEHKGDVLFLSSNTDPFKRARGDPTEFTSAIHEQFAYDCGSIPVDRILDLALHVKCSHGCRQPSPWMKMASNV